MQDTAADTAATESAAIDSEVVAEAGRSVWQAAYSWLDILNRPSELLDMLSTSSEDVGVRLILAGMVVIVGLLCVFNGYRWHKWVVVILSFLAGLWFGTELSGYFGKSTIVAVAIGILAAIVATPLLKIMVALFAGVTGAFIGGHMWTMMVDTPANTQWAGAAMGFIVLAMASFMLFRLVIVLFTSVGGAAMVVFGTLSMLMVVSEWETAIRASLESNPIVVPLLVAVAAVGGFVLQQSRVQACDHVEAAE